MTLTVVNLEVKNLKGIIEATIDAEGMHLVEVTGTNRQGKTTVLDAIWVALRGADFGRESTLPIRQGQKRASVRLDLGDIIVTRVWKTGGPKLGELTLTSDKGTPIPSPQGYLDALLGRFSLNLDAFADLGAKEQVDALIALVDLPYDPYELERTRERVFGERRDAKRDLAKLEARVSALPDVPRGTPKTPIVASELVAELEGIREHNASVDAAEDHLTKVAEDVENDETEVENQTQIVQEAERALNEARNGLKARIATLAATRDVFEEQRQHVGTLERQDDADVRQRLATVDETNRHVAERQQQQAVVKERDDKVRSVDELDDELDRIDEQKREGLAAAQLPIEGLSFDEDGLSFHGIPWKDLSGSERVIVSASIAIAQDAGIRILRIDRGEELDRATIEQLRALATEKDYQLWVSRVTDDPAAGDVRIVAGRVADDEGDDA